MRAPLSPDRRRRETSLRADRALAVGAGGLVVLVGRSGSPVGQLARVAGVVVVSAVVAVALRGWRPPGPVLAWAGGLILTAAGLGIGGPHLVKDAGAVPIGAGATCLVAGLVLLGRAAGHAVRVVPRGGRPLVALGALPTLVVLWALTIAVAATNVPATSVGSRTPRDVGLAYDDVVVESDDGTVLSGWYVPSDTGAAVVLLHGAGSTRAATLDHAAVLARHGYGVLLLDARGHGRSEGAAMDLGWWGDADVDAAVEHLASRPDVDEARIGAVGLSMGGEEALGALGRNRGLTAVVAEGATGRVSSDSAWLADAFGWQGVVQRAIDRLRDAAAAVLTSAPRPDSLRTSVRRAEGRHALVVAAGEVADEVSVARDLERVAPGVVDVWVVPTSGHTDALAVDPDGWEARVVGFLDDRLRG